MAQQRAPRQILPSALVSPNPHLIRRAQGQGGQEAVGKVLFQVRVVAANGVLEDAVLSPVIEEPIDKALNPASITLLVHGSQGQNLGRHDVSCIVVVIQDERPRALNDRMPSMHSAS